MLTKRQRARKFIKRIHQRLRPSSSHRVLFIAGAQRSGTNFLSDVIDRCWDSDCFHEDDQQAFVDYELKPDDTIQKLVNQSKARLVLFKSICDSQRVGHLLELFPDTRCLWAFRRYTDVINSSLKRFSDHNSWLEDMLYHPEKARWRVQNVTDTDMERVRYFYEKGVDAVSARALIWYLRNIQYFQQGLDHNPRVRLTSYEMLVTNPREFFPKIFSWLTIDASSKAYDIAFSSSVGKESPQAIDPEIKTLCDELYVRLTDCFEYQW